MNLKVICLSLLCFPLHAGTMGSEMQLSPLNWVGTFSIGPTWVQPGSQQTLELTPQIQKTYTAYEPQNTLANGEVFLGVKKDLPYDLFAHIGVAGALTSQAGLSGQVWDDADAQFNNYLYGYHI